MAFISSAKRKQTIHQGAKIIVMVVVNVATMALEMDTVDAYSPL